MSEFMTVAGARSMVAGLEAAMSLAPRVDTAAQLAAVYSTLSRDREALKLIEFVWGRWQNIENGMNYAMMLQDVCEWGRAARIAETAHWLDPENQYGKLLYAESLLRQGLWKQAWPLYNEGPADDLGRADEDGAAGDLPAMGRAEAGRGRISFRADGGRLGRPDQLRALAAASGFARAELEGVLLRGVGAAFSAMARPARAGRERPADLPQAWPRGARGRDDAAGRRRTERRVVDDGILPAGEFRSGAGGRAAVGQRRERQSGVQPPHSKGAARQRRKTGTIQNSEARGRAAARGIVLGGAGAFDLRRSGGAEDPLALGGAGDAAGLPDGAPRALDLFAAGAAAGLAGTGVSRVARDLGRHRRPARKFRLPLDSGHRSVTSWRRDVQAPGDFTGIAQRLEISGSGQMPVLSGRETIPERAARGCGRTGISRTR